MFIRSGREGSELEGNSLPLSSITPGMHRFLLSNTVNFIEI